MGADEEAALFRVPERVPVRRAQRAAPPQDDAVLRTEADVVRAWSDGVVTLRELYESARRAGVEERDGGARRIPGHSQDTVSRRRLRGALQTLKASDRATRVGSSLWLLCRGSRAWPEDVVLVVAGEMSPLARLVLADAARLFSVTEEPLAMVVADPPWALGRDVQPMSYTRSREAEGLVVPGYVDVPPGVDYRRFCEPWMAAALEATRVGGYLAVVTGPQQAAAAQVAAEDTGWTYVNSIVVTRTMPMYERAPRRLLHSHVRVTLLCRGSLGCAARRFVVPADLPPASSGVAYPRDVWTDIGDFRRPSGALRYPNALHPKLYARLLRMCTDVGEWVADPFLGSGTALVAATLTGRRLLAGDVNQHALRFAVARVLAEAAAPGQESLFAVG